MLSEAAVDVPKDLKAREDDFPIPIVIMNERISCALNETLWRSCIIFFLKIWEPSAAFRCEAFDVFVHCMFDGSGFHSKHGVVLRV